MEQRDLQLLVMHDCIVDYARLIVQSKCPKFKYICENREELESEEWFIINMCDKHGILIKFSASGKHHLTIVLAVFANGDVLLPTELPRLKVKVS